MIKFASVVVAILIIASAIYAASSAYYKPVIIENDTHTESPSFTLKTSGYNSWVVGFALRSEGVAPGASHKARYMLDGEGHFILTMHESGCIYKFGYYTAGIPTPTYVALSELDEHQPCEEGPQKTRR